MKDRDGTFETNEKITKVSLPPMTLLPQLKTSSPMTNSNPLIPPYASNNYVIDELTQEVIDIKKRNKNPNLEFEDSDEKENSDDDLDEMDKKYLK
ncbi:hypothetical protein Glove_469g34 [Diversispora epigaea]|uniref:Uncharacterized protein n=1 Tax=Diversispora epigaea TaxID=1348612 RepID=A0A397GNH2_9GLOM|nr:hypothetical protein Glove_469g34 [Diversispora epigaea]